MKGQVYIFDLDGTLIDSMPTGVGIVLSFLEEQGISYPDDMVKKLTPLGYKGTAAYYVNTLGVQTPVEEVYGYFQEKTKVAYGEYIPLKKGVAKTLYALREKGCRLNILTASPHALMDICLKRLGVYELFENIWSIDDFGLTKADEKIYTTIAERLGVTPQKCIMADDNVNVLKTAKRVGMQTVGVYDESAKDEVEEMQAVADLYVRELSELIEE
ncbi:MAG: HAD family hydrolase [Clostridia bacterium]|nr:HAD family hydrolase [Clostridia bacterium]